MRGDVRWGEKHLSCEATIQSGRRANESRDTSLHPHHCRGGRIAPNKALGLTLVPPVHNSRHSKGSSEVWENLRLSSGEHLKRLGNTSERRCHNELRELRCETPTTSRAEYGSRCWLDKSSCMDE